MYKSSALRNKIAHRMGASQSPTKNMVSHIHVKRSCRNRIQMTPVNSNGKGANLPCGQR